MPKNYKMTPGDDVYRRLQKHLDEHPVGFPSTRSGADVRLLKRLFTPEEAKLALFLTYRPQPVQKVIESSAREFLADETLALLESMLMKGAVGWKKKNGVDHWYVMPLVIGMYEAQDGILSRGFYFDVGSYMKTLDYGKSFLAVKPSQMRTIPIDRSITPEHNVATYDQIRNIIQNAPGPFVAVRCICREASALRKKPCSKTQRLETCLGFGNMALAALKRKHGREVSREEALEILRQNESDGLVLQPANAEKPEFVCSCCGCCCGMLSFLKMLPRPVDFWASNFRAEVDAEACLRCGKCVSRCQTNAVALKGRNRTAKINANRCIGCGLCVTACPSKAIRLRKNEIETVPPEDEEALNEAILSNKKSAVGKIGVVLKAALRMKP
jgi:Na+-translocating ferredoxin:NAD+ oxidoreductase subunit B